MAARDEIIGFLDELLDAARLRATTARTGSRCPAPSEVDHVVTGVSAHRELFERAAGEGAQLVLCHHGLFWKSTPQVIDAADEGRA